MRRLRSASPDFVLGLAQARLGQRPSCGFARLVAGSPRTGGAQPAGVLRLALPRRFSPTTAYAPVGSSPGSALASDALGPAHGRPAGATSGARHDRCPEAAQRAQQSAAPHLAT